MSETRFCPTCTASYAEGVSLCPTDGTALILLSGSDDPLLGETVAGRFKVLSRLGAGGMGVVYRALQQSVGREVALKVMHRRYASDDESAKRFVREARIASQVTHANLVTVIDFGQTEEGLLFLAMELLDGQTLRDVLAEEAPLPLDRVVRIVGQICDALTCAHRAGIVHRDIKPGNVILLDGPSGRDVVKLVDFGLAKAMVAATTLTASGAVMGTPLYMAPELATDGAADERTDLYALGVMLYEMLTGRRPFDAPTLEALVVQHVRAPPPPLGDGIAPVLERLVHRLLAKDPERRYQSAAMLRDALLAVEEATHRATVVVPEAQPERVSPMRWLGLVVAALLGAGVAWWLSGPSEPGPAPAAQPPTPSPVAVRVVADAPAAPPPLTPDAGAESARADAPKDAETLPPLVTFEVRASPAARVEVDGVEQGMTPQTLELPEGEAPVTIRLSRRGYRTVRRELAPDRDRVVDVELVRAAVKKRPAPAKEAPAPPPEEKPRSRYILGD